MFHEIFFKKSYSNHLIESVVKLPEVHLDLEEFALISKTLELPYH